MVDSRALICLFLSALVPACGGGSSAGATGADATSPVGDDGAADVLDVLPMRDVVTSGDVADAADAAVDVAPLLAVTDVTVEPNPNSVLSCFVSWNTAVAASSSVEVEAQDGSGSFRIRDAAPVLAHRVLIIGLHAASAYRLTAVSEAGVASGRSAPLAYVTSALPARVPVPIVRGTDPKRAQPGWTLLNVKLPTGPALVVMYDEAGRPVWYSERGAETGVRGDVQVSLTADHHVLVGPSGLNTHAEELDLAGNVLWTGPENPTPNGLETHHFGRLADGSYLTLHNDVRGTVTGTVLDRLDASRTVLWSWNAFDLLPVGTGDWTHGNSVTYTPTRVLASFRNLSQVVAIDPADGHVVWTLGAGGDFTVDASATPPWFSLQHEPELEADGRILLYDNGTPARGFSRVLEYQLDEVAHTAHVTWEYPGKLATDAWFSTVWGDADRLANGDVLVTAGQQPVNAPSRVFEVTPAGEKLFELEFNPAGVYRAERVVPPLIEALPAAK
jgi:hypothetical protein